MLLLFSILWFIFREVISHWGLLSLIGILASLDCYNRVPKIEGSKNQKFTSHNSGDWKPEIKVLGIQYVVRILFWFREGIFLLAPHMVESELWFLCILLGSQSNQIRLTLLTSFHLITAISPNISPNIVILGIRVSRYTFGRTQAFSP